MAPFVFSQTEKTVTPEVIEMSGDASSVVNLLQQVLDGSQKENINQHFRVRTVDGNIIMESDDYKQGVLEQLK
ncbi:hypothetical protein GCK72_017681 [Caenorhabditis remanei]|uniref:Uncharacterized protein n=1 Tax=Caenorhabditis remanei TaxID=31234 RepID=A0A6A5G7Y6_CAERE|nr:hypothetical protein GCK72_017681 [Caenorhabditis remanei]KAF1751127.1 hypothetical protein GCK72_017681 [Caenorhabditis remanei]